MLEPADPHLCCGSAGTYNIMQPEISAELKNRKVATLEALTPDVISAGNIGCMMQIGGGTGIPWCIRQNYSTGPPADRSRRPWRSVLHRLRNRHCVSSVCEFYGSRSTRSSPMLAMFRKSLLLVGKPGRGLLF